MGLCVLRLAIFVMIAKIYVLSLIIVIKSEVWMHHQPFGELGQEIMIRAAFLAMLFS